MWALNAEASGSAWWQREIHVGDLVAEVAVNTVLVGNFRRIEQIAPARLAAHARRVAVRAAAELGWPVRCGKRWIVARKRSLHAAAWVDCGQHAPADVALQCRVAGGAGRVSGSPSSAGRVARDFRGEAARSARVEIVNERISRRLRVLRGLEFSGDRVVAMTAERGARILPLAGRAVRIALVVGRSGRRERKLDRLARHLEHLEARRAVTAKARDDRRRAESEVGHR